MAADRATARVVDFLVRRDDLHAVTFAEGAAAARIDLRPGQILLAVDRFAFTANNVTYAVFGEAMAYWSFFPAAPGFGQIPVWGFGDVVRSASDAIAEGERIYGYLPMSTHVVLQPDGVAAARFVDATPHRLALPPVYNVYTRVAHDPHYVAARESEQMLFLPLFMTAFLLDDFLAENDLFDARAVVLASASSKTAIGLASLLARRRSCEVIGLTSPAHAAFVERLGCYDRVVSYDRITSLAADVPVAFVDMAGDGRVTSEMHHHFGDRLRHSGIVGATHWDRRGAGGALPGPEPTLFFAPTQLEKRAAEWGPGGLEERFAAAWRPFVAASAAWLTVVEGRGRDAVRRVYQDTVDGRSRPDQGHVLSLFEVST
jgi:hypothetical protein